MAEVLSLQLEDDQSLVSRAGWDAYTAYRLSHHFYLPLLWRLGNGVDHKSFCNLLGC